MSFSNQNSEQIIVTEGAQCTVELIRRIRSKLKVLLAKHGESSATIDDVLLACSEHLANLSTHGDEPKCEVLYNPSNRYLEIRDYGDACDSLWQVGQNPSGSSKAGELQESGMGLNIIKQLIPGVKYHSKLNDNSFNSLTLTFPKALPHIVVIDDDPTFLVLCEAYLKGRYIVSLETSAKALLSSGSLLTASLVICDIHMPEMSGPELRLSLIENPDTALVPFIFLTGDDSETKRQEAGSLQIDDYIVKPISKAKLIDTVDRVLLRSQRLRSTLNEKLDESVNRSLWPKGPWEIGGVLATYAYTVASRGGGDFLFQKHLEDRTRFILGDIMGHGEQAKFFAFALSGFLTGLSESLPSAGSASDFLACLSRILCKSEVMANTLVTLQVVDVFMDGRVEICSAGHPPPILINGDIINEMSDVEGPLPGLNPSATYTTTHWELRPSDALLFYTDGLVEALLNTDDVHDLIIRLGTLKLSVPLQADYLSDALLFKQRELDDDVSVFVLSNGLKLAP